MTEPQPLPQREPDSISEDDMQTVPIPARKVVTTFDAASKHERIEVKPPLTRLLRRTITRAFNKWVTFSTSMVLNLNWYPRVEPYVGYGTEHYSRLICRTVYGPFKRQAGRLTRGIRAMLTIPSPHTKVRIAIDGVPLETVQVGASEVHDEVTRSAMSPVNSQPPIPQDISISWPNIRSNRACTTCHTRYAAANRSQPTCSPFPAVRKSA